MEVRATSTACIAMNVETSMVETTECTNHEVKSVEAPSIQLLVFSHCSSVPHTSYSTVHCVHTEFCLVSLVDCSVECSPCSRQRSTRSRSPRGCVEGTTGHNWRSSEIPVPSCRRCKYSWYIVLDIGCSGRDYEPDPSVYHDILSTQTDSIISISTPQIITGTSSSYRKLSKSR